MVRGDGDLSSIHSIQGRLQPKIHSVVHAPFIFKIVSLAGGRSGRLHGKKPGDNMAISSQSRHFVEPPVRYKSDHDSLRLQYNGNKRSFRATRLWLRICHSFNSCIQHQCKIYIAHDRLAE